MTTNEKNVKRLFSLVISLIFVLSLLSFPILNENNVSAIVYYEVTYKAGNYSDISGSSEVTFNERAEGAVFDLPAPSRFSRLGYQITGWYCEYDGKTYNPYSQYKMPNQNVTFTAVWTASTYKISFTSNNGSGNTMYVTGTVGEYISMPEPTFTYSGYVFAGWTYKDIIYQPGESFLVPGVMSGLTLSIKATWTKVTETTTPVETTITTVATTPAETTTTPKVTTTTETTTTPKVTTTTETTTTPKVTTTTETTTTPKVTTTTETTTTPKVTKTTEATTDNGGVNQREYVLNTVLNYSLNSKMIQIPLYDLIDDTDNIESFSINITSNNGTLGTIVASVGLSTITANGGWYQQEFNLNLNDDTHSMEIIIDENIDMNIEHGILQVGYWYGQQQAITLENITVYYSEPPVVTSIPETTEVEETTTVPVTEVTTESTETTTVTETEVTTETTETTAVTETEETTVDIRVVANKSISILLNKPNQDEVAESMDINNDGVINVFDLIYLKRYGLGY